MALSAVQLGLITKSVFGWMGYEKSLATLVISALIIPSVAEHTECEIAHAKSTATMDANLEPQKFKKTETTYIN